MCHPRESRTTTGESERDERAWWRKLIGSGVGESTDPGEPTETTDEPADEPEPEREKDPVPADD